MAERPSVKVTERVRVCDCGCVITLIYRDGQDAGGHVEACPEHAENDQPKPCCGVDSNGTEYFCDEDSSPVAAPMDGFDACPEPTCPLYGKAVMADHRHLDTPAARRKLAENAKEANEPG